MMRYTIYRRPSGEDGWNARFNYETEEEARSEIPSNDSHYVYRVVPFEDDEDIPSYLSNSDLQSQVHSHRF